jgi:hypothetical protein
MGMELDRRVCGLQKWLHHLFKSQRAIFKDLHIGCHVCRYLLACSAAFHPLLTGGIIPTSSPGLMILRSVTAPDFDSESFSISTYSRFTVTAQLFSTFAVMPGQRSSSVGKSFSRGSGAGSSSEETVV